jgi:hypothetical protein
MYTTIKTVEKNNFNVFITKQIMMMPKDNVSLSDGRIIQRGIKPHTFDNIRLLTPELNFNFKNIPDLLQSKDLYKSIDASSRNHLILSVCYHRNIVLTPEEFVNLVYLNCALTVGQGELSDEWAKLLIKLGLHQDLMEPVYSSKKEGGGKTRKVKRVRNKIHTRRKNVYISNSNTHKKLKKHKRTFTRRKY